MVAERLDVILLTGKKASPFEMLWRAFLSLEWLDCLFLFIIV